MLSWETLLDRLEALFLGFLVGRETTTSGSSSWECSSMVLPVLVGSGTISANGWRIIHRIALGKSTKKASKCSKHVLAKVPIAGFANQRWTI